MVEDSQAQKETQNTNENEANIEEIIKQLKEAKEKIEKVKNYTENMIEKYAKSTDTNDMLKLQYVKDKLRVVDDALNDAINRNMYIKVLSYIKNALVNLKSAELSISMETSENESVELLIIYYDLLDLIKRVEKFEEKTRKLLSGGLPGRKIMYYIAVLTLKSIFRRIKEIITDPLIDIAESFGLDDP